MGDPPNSRSQPSPLGFRSHTRAGARAGFPIRHHALRRYTDEDLAVQALSPRQRQTFVLMAAGLSNAQIASELGLSVNTVKSHLHHGYQLLEVAGRAEARRRLAPTHMS